MEVDNIAVIETISDTAHKKQSSPLTTLKKKKDICHTSEIIDLSFDDNVEDNMTVSNVGNLGAHVNDISEQRKLLKDYRSQKRSSCPSSESPIPIDDDDIIVETCETRVTDISSSDSDSDSLPSILPSLNGGSLSNTDSQDMLLNSEDSQTVVPKKKTKYTSEEVQKRKEEARYNSISQNDQQHEETEIGDSEDDEEDSEDDDSEEE
ncbi:histone H2A.Z-specific chaperone CHZ1 [Exaiptasia diaphana]|uniref:Uncharacterized protein n=1 Tax=Exaiptasia diaphana TaxID=2652724 RepID=A0A913X5I5_EXADI|nr:histone H2A.Z-specific chaperone CHZ1 [Exaiptasia diaphana]